MVLGLSVNPSNDPQRDDALTPAFSSASLRPVQARYQLEAQGASQGWDADGHQRAGNIALDMGDFGTAAAHWQAAIALEPNSPDVLQALALIYIETQDWTAAVDTLRTLVALTPENTWAQFQLGIILAPLNPSQAAQHLDVALTDPAYAERAFLLRGVLRQYPNEVVSGITATQVGMTLVELGLWGNAEFAFRHAADMQQSDSQVYAVTIAYVGFTREMQGKTNADWINQAVNIAPDNPQVRYLQGLSLRNYGEYQASIEAFSYAISNDPTNPAYYVEIGNTYWEIQDVVSAEYWLRQAVIVANGDPQFRQIYIDFYTLETPRLIAAGVIVTNTPIATPNNTPVTTPTLAPSPTYTATPE
jgi:tetratricopeptide (TPR) repeat protein